MLFDEENYETLVKLEKLLIEDESIDKMLKQEAGTNQYIIIALEFALPILKEHLNSK